ncbi:hypothetical protein CA236_00630 [Sphingomonas sp. ABOLG]|uniref:Uncharacterized protein n=1 Tax=Sphingomonas olei TaxID=1886787 RepID=A0ABY2QKW4_9SPHN|nr:hypothetical protein CA236_00630 [Sphingomonas sp. ABOLG]THG41608.1 hypothetical protein E5988_03635 [Sphingomonas olei]
MPRRGAERGILRRAHRQRYGRRIRKDPVKARVAIPAADPPGNLHRCHFSCRLPCRARGVLCCVQRTGFPFSCFPVSELNGSLVPATCGARHWPASSWRWR